MHYLYILVLFVTIISITAYTFVNLNKKVLSMEKLLEENKGIPKVMSSLEITGFISLIRSDVHGRINYMSSSLIEKLGYKFDDITNIMLEELSNSEDFLIELQNCQKLMSKELNNFVMDRRIKDKNGNWIWFHCNYVLFKESDISSNEIIIYCLDIDWRKQIERSLNQSYELNELLLNSIDTMIATFDENGDVIAVNKAMENFCLSDEVNNATNKENIFLDSLNNPSSESIPKDIKIRDKIRAVLAGEKSRYAFEYCYNHGLKKNWYLANISSLDNQLGAIVSYTDITRQKELEEKLSKSEESYRTLLEFLPIAVFLQNKDEIVYCNQEGLNMIGLKNINEALGKTIVDYIHFDYKMNFIERFINSDASLSHSTKEILINAEGETIYVEIEKTCIIYLGETMTLFVVKDVSERINADNFRKAAEEKDKQLEEALEYDKIKTEFFANISHELRTPINIIFSALQVINIKSDSSNHLDANSSKYLGMIKQNCYRLLRLVNNLIDITRIDSGFFNISIKNYDIINIVENITLSVAEYVENRNIELIFDTEVEEKQIACDPDKIERIVLNLLANSVKFTPEGGKISVTIYDRNSEIDISIKDTGLGIPEDKLSIIFERFRQVDKTLSRNREGSGIGLSLVKSLAELHHGSISVNSEYGNGSEFIITLPVRTVEDGCNIVDHGNLWQENVEKINVEFSDIYS